MSEVQDEAETGRREPTPKAPNRERDRAALASNRQPLSHAYCNSCKLRFALREQGSNRAQEIWLRCPYCGHLDQYSLADRLRASQKSDPATRLVQ